MGEINKYALEKMISEKNHNYAAVGKVYGMSALEVKKRARALGIALYKRQVKPKVRTNACSKVWAKSDDEFKLIVQGSSTWNDMAKKFGYSNRMSSNVKANIENRCRQLGTTIGFEDNKKYYVEYKTKGELFGQRGSWQSARSGIQRHAREVYLRKNKHAKCAICGYDKHIEIAHIKAVSEFDDSTPVLEINSIDNLIALCPNHHWEYDNGVLEYNLQVAGSSPASATKRQ